MKKILQFFLFWLILFSSFSAVYAQSYYNYYDSGYPYLQTTSPDVINQMDYTMTVNENHSYDILIREQVTFSGYNHGIYRVFPKTGEVYRELDGKPDQRNYYAVINHIDVESGQPYSTSEEDGNLILKIGDPDRVVTGTQNYEYSFTYDPGNDGITSMDDVYFTFISAYLENPVEKLNITINMPKPFSADEVYFYAGDYGATTAGAITDQINNQTITATNTEALSPGETVTVRINLPEGYFVGARTGNEYNLYIYIAAATAIIIGAVLYFLLGKAKKPLSPIEFYPPNDFDPAQVGYILKGSANNQMLVSLIIYFAEKGWLTIENISADPKRPDIYLQRVEDIPRDRPLYEQTIFNALFRRSDNPSLNSLTNKNYVGQAFVTANEQLGDWFSGQNSIYEGSAILSKTFCTLIIFAFGFLFGMNLCYVMMRSVDLLMTIIFTVFFCIGPFIIGYAQKQRSWIGGVLVSVIYGLLTGLFSDNFILGGASILVALCLGYFIKSSTRRTERANKWYGECLGFREFIKTAELKQIKLLAEENPTYYYSILPYAYAMGLTDVWAKHFEGLTLVPPNWYYDPYFDYRFLNTMIFMNTFHHGIRSNIGRIQTRSFRNLGSGGFGGGGFSGGGFGGGGFGGMGGGSW